MVFKLGEPRSAKAGRKKGSINKRNLALREILDNQDFSIVQKIMELLPTLSNEKQADVYLKLMEYCYPKLSAIRLEKTPEELELEKMTDDELAKKAKVILLKHGEDFSNDEKDTEKIQTK